MLTFPLQPAHLFHRYGGKITKIHSIGHEAWRPREGRSQDIWFFLCDVEWNDGTKSEGSQVMPGMLVYDSDHELMSKLEIDQLLAAMNAYLEQHGQWFRGEGKCEGWYADNRAGERKRAR